MKELLEILKIEFGLRIKINNNNSGTTNRKI
jgi:hypothetical protein